ncbi:hypothetical protein Tco_0663127 [Tanacetum coccineum]
MVECYSCSDYRLLLPIWDMRIGSFDTGSDCLTCLSWAHVHSKCPEDVQLRKLCLKVNTRISTSYILSMVCSFMLALGLVSTRYSQITYTPTVLSQVMSSTSAPTILETITPTDRARDSLVITHFDDDPFMIVRQAYTPIATDIESEPLEDPIETKETQPLSLRVAPLSPDYTLASPNYTPNTPHSKKELEPIEASEIRIASPSDSTSPLSLDHPLT